MKREIEDELSQIERQMAVNLEYFSGSDRIVLENLQSHIQDSIARIRLIIDRKSKQSRAE